VATDVQASPSCYSATRLARGDARAVGEVLLHGAVRAALLAAGMAIAGHGTKYLMRDSIAGAVMLEVFLVGWAVHQDARSR